MTKAGKIMKLSIRIVAEAFVIVDQVSICTVVSRAPPAGTYTRTNSASKGVTDSRPLLDP